LRFYLQFVCHDAVDVDMCATQEQRPESLILGNQPTAEVLRTYQVTDRHHTSVQEDSRSSIQASTKTTRLQEKRLSSLTQDAPGLQNDHGSCDGGPVSYLESYQLTGLAIPDMPLHPDCLQEDLTSPTQKTAPSKARLHKDLSLTMAEGCPSSQHDQVLCDKGPTSCLEYMGKILPETHSCHDYEQEDSRSSTTTSRATRLQQKRFSPAMPDAPSPQNDQSSCDRGPISYLKNYRLTGLAMPDMPLQHGYLQEDSMHSTKTPVPTKCRFEGKNLGSTIPDPPPHSQYDEKRCEESMPCLKRYRMTGLAIPIMHHGSLCGSLQEELRNFRWIPAPTEARPGNEKSPSECGGSRGPSPVGQQVSRGCKSFFSFL
jgi:hypothetical protein